MVFMALQRVRGDTIFLVRVVWDPWLIKLHDLHDSTMNHASCHFWGWETVRLTEIHKSSLKSSQRTMVYFETMLTAWFSNRNKTNQKRIFQRLHWTVRSMFGRTTCIDQPLDFSEHDLEYHPPLAFRHDDKNPRWLETFEHHLWISLACETLGVMMKDEGELATYTKIEGVKSKSKSSNHHKNTHTVGVMLLVVRYPNDSLVIPSYFQL